MEKLKILSLTVLTFVTVACSQVNFSSVKDSGNGVVTPSSTPAPVCNVENIYRKTKILFLVDTSGSNAAATYNIINGQTVQTPATDPSKSFRGGAINTFFQTYQHKSNFSWGLHDFLG